MGTQYFDDGSVLFTDDEGDPIRYIDSNGQMGDPADAPTNTPPAGAGRGTIVPGATDPSTDPSSGYGDGSGTSGLEKVFKDIGLGDLYKTLSGGTGLAALLGGLGGLLGANNTQVQKAGYQGGIPRYTAVRGVVPTNDTTRRPGSSGRSYFTDTQYVAPGGDVAAAQTAAQNAGSALYQANQTNPFRANTQKVIPTNPNAQSGSNLSDILRAAQSRQAGAGKQTTSRDAWDVYQPNKAYPTQTGVGAGLGGLLSRLTSLNKNATAPIRNAGGNTSLVDPNEGRIPVDRLADVRRGGTLPQIPIPTAPADGRWDGTEYASGGLTAMAKGRYLAGGTDGMADKIPANIDGNQPAKLSHGEFVVPADVVSHLGNGNSNAGAQRLYSMMDRIRQARTGNKQQGKQINPDKFLPK